MQTLEDKLERAELLLARWHSRLYRAANKVRELDAMRRRILDRIAEAPPGTRHKPAPAETAAASSAPKVADVIAKPFDDPTLDIPAGLRRPMPNAADEAAKADIIAGKADAQKKKRAATKAKAGDALAKKPLTGKAALDYLRS